MSYILDALRKSEKQRRLGQSPDLGSAPPPSAARRKSPSGRLIVFGASAVIVAALGAGWFWWSGNDAATDVTPTPVVDHVPEPEPERSAPVEDPPARAAPVEADEADSAEDRGRRAVVDRRSPTRTPPAASVSRPAPARPGEVETPRPVVPEGERERLVESIEEAERLVARELAERGAEDDGAAVAADTEAPPAPESEAVASTEPPEEPVTSWEPERVDYLEAWELPLDVRREMPELSLSIHVFSTDPRQRFVLINGERRLEGDALGSGARLAEVSRHGAVIEFQDYRFLLRP